MVDTATAEKAGGNTRVPRDAWLAAALDTLLQDGIEAVRVLSLAQRLDVSRSSFYWHFQNREQLLNELLALWREKNTKAIVERAEHRSDGVVDGVLTIFECWTDESLFDPRLDFAIRSWARRAPAVHEELAAADEARLIAIAGMFARHGYGNQEAYIRARVLYYMQIGYYFLDLQEPMETRLGYLQAYIKSFTGRDLDAADEARIQAFVAQHKGLP